MKTGSNAARMASLMTVCLAFLSNPAASADRGGGHARGPGPGPGWHGDIGRFHEHDWGVWRGGHWAHGIHGGRPGWWWVVGGAWYFYPWPVYPYPNPWEPPPVAYVTPPAGTAPPVPPTQYWYYCAAAKTYYPYISTCPGGWTQVPAVPPDASTAEPR